MHATLCIVIMCLELKGVYGAFFAELLDQNC